MTTNEILTGLGLVIVLAIASRLVAERLRIPAIVLLLPVGFIAGAITDDVHPDALFGDTFQPLVSLGVGLILFEAGLRLRPVELAEGVRRIVVRLITGGVLITLASITLAVKLILGLDWGVSAVLGAILVVSGPTVVLPLLAFVRPADRVRTTLKWEGTLIDPIGALLGVIAFQAVLQGANGSQRFHAGELTLSIAVGLGIGLLGAAVLLVLLRSLQRSTPGQGVVATLMVLAAAVVAADVLRDDSGLVAAAVMGMALARQDRLDIASILEFHETIVGLLIGILFVLISASVTPSQVSAVLPQSLGLIALMVLVIRPVVVAIGTRGSPLGLHERAFAAWMAPRGIVAAATASAFGASLTQAGVAGAGKILPIAFVVIFGTVVLYGLSAAPVARRLGVAGAGAPVVLLVGAQDWARSLAAALRSAGVRVRLWTDRLEQQAAAREEGLEVRSAPFGVEIASRQAELEEVSSVLLLTGSDEFNALAGYELRQELGIDRVYRLQHSRGELDTVPAYTEGAVLFGEDLTFEELERRFANGARVVEVPFRDGSASLREEGLSPLFVFDRAGGIVPVTADSERSEAAYGARAICLTGGGEADPARATS